jgi:glucose/mannose transport system permease protein
MGGSGQAVAAYYVSAPARAPARRRRRLTRDRVVSLALITPSLIAVGVFVYGMIGWTTFVSFTKWNTFSPNYALNGFANYVYIFNNARFQLDLRNNIVFTIFFVAISLVIGLTLASLLDRHIKGESFFRSLFLFPMAISFIVTGVVWKWLLTPSAGYNLLLGLDPTQNKWFTDPSLIPGGPTGQAGMILNDIGLGFLASTQWGIPVALLSLVIAAVWQMSGFVMALYLAGLRGIPDDLREAARVDGASEAQVYRRIVLPLLTPVTVTAIIILGHISLKIYDLEVAMTGQGIGFATDFPASYMFQTSFNDNQFARGAAVGVVMLVMVATLIVPYLIWNRRQEIGR